MVVGTGVLAMNKYLAVWGVGYSCYDYDGKAEVAEVELEYFTAGMGYNKRDIALVAALEVGASCDLTEHGAHHSVVRIA